MALAQGSFRAATALSHCTFTKDKNHSRQLSATSSSWNGTAAVRTSSSNLQQLINVAGQRQGRVAVQAFFGKKNAESEKKAPVEEEEPKESLFTTITNALDFAAIRSEEDAVLLREASKTTRAGGKMSRDQYLALRRKVGGTSKSFFKEFIDVEGAYTDEGWVDKRCKYCKKDTAGEARQKDSFGTYSHVACAEKAKNKKPLFSLFG